MKLFLFSALAALALSARADAPWASAEHMFYLRIETDPSDATVSSVPAKEGTDAVVIGKTPFVVPIEMNWDRSYMRKKWEKLRVAARGNIATNEYDKEDKSQTVLLTFAIEKPGYARQVVQQVAGVFQYNEHAEDWDHAINELPEKRTINIALVPVGETAQDAATQSAAATNPAVKKAAVNTVIVASGKIGSADSLGYALVQEPDGAAVIVDGVRAGSAPLRVMLAAGNHNFNTLQNGKPTPLQTIAVTAGKTTNVSLQPAK